MNALSSISLVSPRVNIASGTNSVKESPGTSSVKESSGNPAIRQPVASDQGLNAEDLKKLTELKARDREVRSHEAAHQAAGGQHAGAISLTFERGPDGAQYAVGGEVPIDVSPVAGDPQATIEKMRTVRAAAMAPAEPSSQDRAVAAQAMQTMLQAQAELSTDRDSSTGSAAEPRVNGEEAGGNGEQSFSSRQANDTYQSVSELSDATDLRRSGFLDIAV